MLVGSGRPTDRHTQRRKDGRRQCSRFHAAKGGVWEGRKASEDDPSVLQVGFQDSLGHQFSQDIVQVVGVRVPVTGEVGPKFRLVVDLVPDHRVGFPGCV